MNKQRKRQIHKKLRHIKPWHLLTLTLISGLICVVALRANNQQMYELREQVYAADKNNGDVKGALQELQAYVTTHMNTNLSSGTSVYPPIQLKYTYERLQQEQTAKLGGGDIYSQAQKYCEQQNPRAFSGGNRITCIEQYVSAHKSGELVKVPEDLYKFSFQSPRWSPDLAGFSMLATILFAFAFLASLVARWLNKMFS